MKKLYSSLTSYIFLLQVIFLSYKLYSSLTSYIPLLQAIVHAPH